MRKIITISVLFLSFASFAQIKVIETVPVEKLGKVNNNYIQKIGDEYTVFYNCIQSDDENNTLRKFTFKNIDNDYLNLYNIIVNGFTATPLYDIKLELPNNYVWLHYTASVDKPTVQFMVSNKEGNANNVSEALTKDQVSKLFQK